MVTTSGWRGCTIIPDALKQHVQEGQSLYAAAPEEVQPGGERTGDPSQLPTIKDVVDDALTPGTGGRRKAPRPHHRHDAR